LHEFATVVRDECSPPPLETAKTYRDAEARRCSTELPIMLEFAVTTTSVKVRSGFGPNLPARGDFGAYHADD
jgi:hypothetical protein